MNRLRSNGTESFRWTTLYTTQIRDILSWPRVTLVASIRLSRCGLCNSSITCTRYSYLMNCLVSQSAQARLYRLLHVSSVLDFMAIGSLVTCTWQGNQQRRTGPHEFQAFERHFDGVCNFEDQPAMTHHCYC